MKILWNDKDGGPDSKGWLWGFEWKSGFSVLLVRFRKGSRDAYHSHAFHALSWLLWGRLMEEVYGMGAKYHTVEPVPILTLRSTLHKVTCLTNNSWAVTFRGPWRDTWKEYIPKDNRHLTLTHGRKEVNG